MSFLFVFLFSSLRRPSLEPAEANVDLFLSASALDASTHARRRGMGCVVRGLISCTLSHPWVRQVAKANLSISHCIKKPLKIITGSRNSRGGNSPVRILNTEEL